MNLHVTYSSELIQVLNSLLCRILPKVLIVLYCVFVRSSVIIATSSTAATKNKSVSKVNFKFIEDPIFKLKSGKRVPHVCKEASIVIFVVFTKFGKLN